MKYKFKIIGLPINEGKNFISIVEKRLNEGWQLHGVLIVDQGILYQSMTKAINPYDEDYEEGETCNQE